jgi:hypothetical protein
MKLNITKMVLLGFTSLAITSSCQKDGNPNNLPDTDPSAYEGKIDGYDSSDQIFPSNLKAYWSFDDTKNELKSNSSPTATSNDSYVNGLKGKAIRLQGGYLYYGKQFDAFKTDAFKDFTISSWIQILNNGSKRTMLFQLARPGIFNGNINFALNTNAFPATNTNELKIQPTFTGVNGGMQDNVNTKRDNPGDANYVPYLTPTIGADKWTHVLITYTASTGLFNIWADGIKIGAFPSRGTSGTTTFKSYEPSEVIIGGNYNVIPGKTVNADVNFAAMTGNIDELRIYDIALPDAHIKALYNLGKAGK